MKTCTTCGQKKLSDEFQVRSASRDGLTASCKSCLRERDKARYHNSDARREYCKSAWSRYPDSARKSRKKWLQQNAEKRRAHQAVNNAVRDGKIEKPTSCEMCGDSGRIHGHHDDYSKPLDVKWLCAACHSAVHANEVGVERVA